ncbi:hypothetical protein BJF79_02360 [Actinomadura sp. CNU-125]|uniref:hypothetical protein n=1 Tax=Actinomadura sp. CNU-125 TaxID=1904961 RepID=UPI000961D063|nr:hypothetical protein [Actinomadura sp. CNU-125]OLT19092.1 hypothetical protein BJF79_02360 [Actinomadura sp. CNU-125]
MKDVLAYVERRVAALDDHPLFAWLASDELPPKQRLMILPSVATVAMGFRDVNKWVLRYPHAADDLERGINVHTFEDQTHSRLFLEDWKRLGLDRRLGWDASDTLWWLFRADANEVIRGHCMYFLSIAAADRGDPLLRFAHAEVGELCARELFFKHISAVAGELSDRTGLAMLYFGAHHIEAEGEGAEEVFESLVLDPERRRRARELADVMIDVFREILDGIHEYALKHAATGTPPRPAADRPPGPAGRIATADVPVHPSQAPVVRFLQECRTRSGRHPFYTWLGHHGPGISATQVLQRFVPLWAMDVMGYRDLHRYAVGYPEPASELERTVNVWGEELTDRNELFVDDWKRLDLDELLGWNAGDTLEFYYLSRTMDVHRHNRVAMTKFATGHHDPMLRLWLVSAMSEATDILLGNLVPLAERAESDTGLRLDYLAGRRKVAAPPFLDRPIKPEQRDIAVEMIETAFDFMDRRLDMSLDVALSNDFQIP